MIGDYDVNPLHVRCVDWRNTADTTAANLPIRVDSNGKIINLMQYLTRGDSPYGQAEGSDVKLLEMALNVFVASSPTTRSTLTAIVFQNYSQNAPEPEPVPLDEFWDISRGTVNAPNGFKNHENRKRFREVGRYSIPLMVNGNYTDKISRTFSKGDGASDLSSEVTFKNTINLGQGVNKNCPMLFLISDVPSTADEDDKPFVQVNCRCYFID